MMQSWPTLSIPESDFSFPPLKLNTSNGLFSERGKVFRSYVCGITPYDATHLGHAATYLTFDLIHRYQSLRRQRVDFVENITDIDDPLLERAIRDGQDWFSLAGDQINLFKEDMTALRVLPPKDYVPVTEVIDDVVSAIQAIKAKDFTYEISGDLYFRITPFLDLLPIEYNQALKIFAERGGDPAREGKEHPLDPLLWQKNRTGEPGWESPMGFGRPGWHIECSVIALKFLLGADYLSDTDLPDPLIDLQGGGSDLIFPHHFMSAALATAITGKRFACAFVHTGMVGLEGEKMSKSKGNLVFVSKLLASGVDPMVLRFALINSNYSEDRMWSSDILNSAQLQVTKIRKALSRQFVDDPMNYISEMISAISHNLDIPKALEILINWADNSLIENNSPESFTPGTMSRFIDSVLGLAL
jgi:L-cysteine:1D-myo-inositol 2-amino-2-deoxy-alpha-D-glucopyranoside ligase